MESPLEIVALSVGNGFCAVGTSDRIVRVFSKAGCQVVIVIIIFIYFVILFLLSPIMEILTLAILFFCAQILFISSIGDIVSMCAHDNLLCWIETTTLFGAVSDGSFFFSFLFLPFFSFSIKFPTEPSLSCSIFDIKR